MVGPCELGSVGLGSGAVRHQNRETEDQAAAASLEDVVTNIATASYWLAVGVELDDGCAEKSDHLILGPRGEKGTDVVYQWACFVEASLAGEQHAPGDGR